MRIDDQWIRSNLTTFTLSSHINLRVIEYKNHNPQSNFALIRVSSHHSGNITATITPRTQAVLSKLIELFVHEPYVNWSSIIGSATFHVTKNDQSELFRLFEMLTRFDLTFLPIKDDLQKLLQGSENHDDEHAGTRRQRSHTL